METSNKTIDNSQSDNRSIKSILKQQKEINRAFKRFRSLILNSSDVFSIIDADGQIKYTNIASKKVIGYKPNELIGRHVSEFYKDDNGQALIRLIKAVIKEPDKEIKGEILFNHKKGRKVYLEVYMKNQIEEPDIEGIIVNFRDITQRKLMEKRMSYMITHDGLTGLPNEVGFNNKLKACWKKAVEEQVNFALLMLDIEGAKFANYSLGYEVGKGIIIDVVERLRGFLGEEVYISRIQGDHFAIILNNIKSFIHLEDKVIKMINLFSKPFNVDSYQIDISVNIGICFSPKDVESIDMVKERATSALMRSRRDGRNRYKFYSAGLDIENYKELSLTNDLHRAIENKQFITHYQPIVKIDDNRILAVEALIRWDHPDWGMIPPFEFLPIAESNGFVINIGNFVLREACKNYKEWLGKKYPDIKISINVSTIEFFHKDFAKNIINTIKEFQLNPEFLILEITESILMENPDKAISDINKLRTYGIQIALDDFGTGYSSLAYLKLFKIDIIKLDASFIKNIAIDHTSNVITSTILKMAKELKLKVVAEGIEDNEQLAHLKRLDCYSGQGYLYSKPLPAEEFEEILKKGKSEPDYKKVEKEKRRERRKDFRVHFSPTLDGFSTIKEVNNRKVNMGYTKIAIKNIGPGGLSFMTNLNLPLDKNIILGFSLYLHDREVNLSGELIWRDQEKNNLSHYGVEFIIEESEKIELKKTLERLKENIRKNII